MGNKGTKAIKGPRNATFPEKRQMFWGGKGTSKTSSTEPATETIHEDEQATFLHEETTILVQTTHFTYEEIEYLRQRIAALDSHLKPEYLSLTHPVSKHLFQFHSSSYYLVRLHTILDVDQKGYLSFKDLIYGLSILSQRATREEKYQLSFNLLDTRQKGYLVYEDILRMMQACLMEAKLYGYLNLELSTDQIHAIIRATFEEAHLKPKQTIGLRTYMDLCDAHPGVLEFITLDLTNLFYRKHSSTANTTMNNLSLTNVNKGVGGGAMEESWNKLSMRTSEYDSKSSKFLFMGKARKSEGVPIQNIKRSNEGHSDVYPMHDRG